MTGEYVWDPGEANPKQKLFFASRSLYTAYGGAKGGGKTWAVRTKALLGAYNYAGIRILILRRTYPELQSNHIEPMLRMINPEFCSYNGSLHSSSFSNGSLIHFGHWAGENSELEYNGQEYDWIFLDEATQFTWRSFQFLGGLLRGVNDCTHIMKKLVHELVKMRVRPYYIYICDLSLGIGHFRTPVSKGIEIIENLRGHTSGYAVPTFVVDAPGGGGKIPVMPNYVISQAPNRVVLRNYEGVITTYTEPTDYKDECHCEECEKARRKEGVAELLSGGRLSLEPSELSRKTRNHNH